MRTYIPIATHADQVLKGDYLVLAGEHGIIPPGRSACKVFAKVEVHGGRIQLLTSTAHVELAPNDEALVWKLI